MPENQPVIFINEQLDMSGASHRRIEDSGIILRLGRSMWDHPELQMTDEEMIDSCQGAVGVQSRKTSPELRTIPSSLGTTCSRSVPGLSIALASPPARPPAKPHALKR